MRRLLALAAIVAALALPAGVLADTTGGSSEPPAAYSDGMSIVAGDVTVTAKLVVTIPVTVTCQPKPPSEYPVRTYWEEYGLQAWVKQAAGRQIAFGEAWASFRPDDVCDGSPHVVVATVSADPSGPAFRNGSAVVAVAGSAYWWGYNEETWEEFGESAGASTGWVATRLRK